MLAGATVRDGVLVRYRARNSGEAARVPDEVKIVAKKAAYKDAKRVTDRPVFAGCVGPFSLAGRLTDVSEAMILCYEDPDNMKILLEKCTEFLIKYAKEYKKIGANGIIMAEPLAGVLSPDLAAEFSEPYVRAVVEAVQD